MAILVAAHQVSKDPVAYAGVCVQGCGHSGEVITPKANLKKIQRKEGKKIKKIKKKVNQVTTVQFTKSKWIKTDEFLTG